MLESIIKLPKEGWEEGKSELHKKFKEKTSESEADIAEVFPLSPIPLLIDIGSLLTGKVPLLVLN